MSKRIRRDPESGQILILMSLLSTTLIILFGMVVSIGHLVQAKVNLQNAVDLAAMSGASWQARYLNNISLVNYRMRQNYKFLLYDLYVTQSRFNRGLINQLSGNIGTFDRIPHNQVVFGICQQTRGYCGKVAVGEDPSCTAMSTDMCRNAIGSGNQGDTIPPIVPSPVVNTNPALIAANALIAQLGAQARQICDQSNNQNKAYFNYITTRLKNQQIFQMEQMAQILSDFAGAFSQDSGGAMNSSATADASIMGTFYGNLISANGQAQLTYINDPANRTYAATDGELKTLSQTILSTAPPAGAFSNYFERQTVKLAMPVVNFSSGGGGCSISVQNMQSPANASDPGMFLGLSRAHATQTLTGGAQGSPTAAKVPFFVALQAKVTPKLLFWPQGLVPTLVAVGAAKPFGSRIGPPAAQTSLEVSGVANDSGDYYLANMSFYPGDFESGDGAIPGIGNKKILSFLRSKLPDPDIGVNEDRPSVLNQTCTDGSDNFLCLALAPTLYESLFWNVFPNDTSYPYEGSVQAMYPNDVSIQVADSNAYAMPDRMGAANLSTAQSSLWHYSMTIGDNPEFKSTSGAPVFFGTKQTIFSSWSPLSPDTLLSQGGGGGRIGYQIKLTSLNQLCEEVESGGMGSCTSGLMSAYFGQDIDNVHH